MTDLTAYRVSLINSQGVTCGPMFGNNPTTWAPTLTASCHRNHTPPDAHCGCGIYATATRAALALVWRAARELIEAAHRTLEEPDIFPEVWVRDTDTGHPILIDRRTTGVLLQGRLEDAVPVDAPPFELVPVTRWQLLPPWKPAAWTEEMGRTAFLAQKEGTEPEGTHRGSRFIVTAVHAVSPSSWLREIVDPVPLVAHSSRDALLAAEARA